LRALLSRQSIQFDEECVNQNTLSLLSLTSTFSQ
jgi:hypothetical protein